MEPCSSELYVDGRNVPSEVVSSHYQEDPYPGDHRYRVTIRGRDLAQHLLRSTNIVEFGTYENLDDETCTRVFFNWHRLTRRTGEGTSPSEYVLNNIEVMRVSPHQVLIEGVCSTAAKVNQDAH
jgi:hypothetical protein